VVNEPVEQVWPVLREFWQEMGFIIAVDNPQVGVMETDWAENRAKIPKAGCATPSARPRPGLLAPERDRYRTRVERTADGKSTRSSSAIGRV